MSNSSRPILVTGAHRSGSTWIGRMLALSSEVGYIQEPFNLHHRPGICSAEFNYWFPYISQKNGEEYYSSLKDTIEFKYKVGREIQAVTSFRDFGRMLRDCRNFNKYRMLRLRPLLKDPIAIFSAEWLASSFDMDVVVIIRHPAAFVASIKAKNWTFPFQDLLKQSLLMEECLYPFASEISHYATSEKDIIDQACLLWNIIYFRVSEYQKRNPTWIFQSHEDISVDPVSAFQEMYQRLGLDFSDDVKTTIEEYSNPQNPLDAKKNDPFLFLRRHLKRDSKSNIFNWKKRLDSREILRIKEKTGGLASVFYDDSCW